jgi:hypothetical protein
MRILLFITAIILLLVTIGFKFFKNRNDLNDTEHKKTVVEISKKMIDVGDRPRLSSIIGKYTLYNNGKEDLYIEDVKPDCHCTVGEYSKRPVKPTDSTIVVLRYDSSITGFFQSSAMVSVNSEQTPLLLILRGKIIDSVLR